MRRRMQFNLVIEGDENLENLFLKSVQEYPNMQKDLIHAMGHAILMALRLQQKDNISIVGFNCGFIKEEKKEEKPIES